MAQTRVDPFQVEPGSSGQVMAVNSSGTAEWQASGVASGQVLKFSGAQWVPSEDKQGETSKAFAFMMG